MRSIILRSHFGKNDNKNLDPYHALKESNNEWLPKKVHHTVDSFIEKFHKDLSTLRPNTNINNDNLTKPERQALNQLKLREDIIITRADKGGAVVIIDVIDYVKEANRQLNDTNYYAELSYDPTKQHEEIVNETIKTFTKDKLLPEQLGKNLLQNNSKTPNIYFLPKIHKINNPGRPIVGSIGSPTAKISHFVDIHLEKIVNEIKSHIKDTTDFINKIETITDLPENTILVTMDVKSLFTNIPNSEGINAVAKALEKQTDLKIPTRVIIKFLHLILTLNNFGFNGRNILQKKGSSMGSKSSCRYADVFMDDFETKHIYPRTLNRALAYHRFVDDIFMLWTESEANLKAFFEQINKVHSTIKFDYKYSYESIEFLDTLVFKNDKNSLSTKLYSKPTDRPAYTHVTSYHPKSQIQNIPYGQAMRVKRICTEEEDFQAGLSKLKKDFQTRGYKEPLLEEQFAKVRNIDRKQLLTYNEKKGTDKIKFITKYNRSLPNIRTVMESNWHLLQTNEELAKAFEDKPILAFRRNRNLRDILGGMRLENNSKVTKKPSKSGRCAPCLSQVGNICCKHIISCKSFRSARTNEKFEIKHRVNCKTKKGTYLGLCLLCTQYQYIGKFETPWNQRLYNHRKDAKKTKSIPYDEHFRLPGHDFNKHARFIIIEALDRTTDTLTDRKILKEREDYWISRLNTHYPNGFNDRFNGNIRNKIQQVCT